MKPVAILDCNGCTACCQNDLIYLHPEEGDVVAEYDTMPFRNPLTGKDGYAIRKVQGKPCIYLDEATGCTIWERRPRICQTFDCRRAYQKFGASMMKRMIAAGAFSQEVADAGRKRLKGAVK